MRYIPLNFILRWLNKNKTYNELKEYIDKKNNDSKAILLVDDFGDLQLIYSNFSSEVTDIKLTNKDKLIKLLKQTKHNRMIVKVRKG